MKKFLPIAMSLVLAGNLSLPAFAAEEVKAVPSSQKVYINGQMVDLKAYNIDGRNYFMLQDLGNQLQFGVEFDKATNSVKITPPAAVMSEEQAKTSDTAKPAQEAITLKDWMGTWNSMALYLDDKALDSVYEAKAKKENKSAEEIKKEKKETYASDVAGIVITENTIKYYDAKVLKEGGEGKLAGEDTYKFVESVKFGKGMWAKFEATNPNPKFKYFMTTSIHGDDMAHFHIRFGNKSFEELMEQKSYPTFIKYDTTIEKLKEEIEE